MSIELKQTNAVPRDEAAPADGDDLVSQLQHVLDEAGAQLGDGANPPGARPEGQPDAVAEGVFESPTQVLAANAAADLDQQLQELIDIAGGGNPQRGPGDALNELPDETAKAVTREIQQLTAMVHEAITPATPAQPREAESANAEMLTVQQILQLSEGSASQPSDPEAEQEAEQAKATAAAGPNAPAFAPVTQEPAPKPSLAPRPAETMNQLDEFLAGHADHAVGDEFETPDDVIAVEKAIAESQIQVPKVIAADVLAAPAAAATVQPALAEPSFDDDAADPAPGAAPAAPVAAVSEPLPTPAAAVPAAPIAAASTPRRRRLINPRRVAALTTAVCTQGLYRFCAALNQPLRKASPATRNLVGYAGLMTIINGSLLIVGKLLFSLMG